MRDAPKAVLLVAMVLAGCGGSATPPGTADTDDTDDTDDTAPIDTSDTPPPAGQRGCVDSTPILLVDGRPSGWEICADRARHRVSAVAPGARQAPVEACTTDQEDACASDADCTARPHGHCGLEGDYTPSCQCTYECSADTDCDAGSICLAGELRGFGSTFSQCVPAACATDADCPSGECGLSIGAGPACSLVEQLRCREETDVCRVGSDCETGFVCAFASDAWSCEPGVDCR